jgi:hypothetical protein
MQVESGPYSILRIESQDEQLLSLNVKRAPDCERAKFTFTAFDHATGVTKTHTFLFQAIINSLGEPQLRIVEAER